MDYKKIITTTAATAILFQAAIPAFAATELVISGNGSDSVNDVQVTQQSSTTVVQTNTTEIDNDIDIETNTGGNKASDNTGGDVYVETGDTDAYVEVSNQVNSNVAEVENCGDCDGGTYVLIEGNGTGTENYVGLKDQSAVDVFQDNYADINNDVDLELETGDNEAEDNTGGGVVIVTGDVDATVKIHNLANANSAYVAGGGSGGGVDLVISGNGSDSLNDIDLGLGRYTLLAQANVTDIDNDVDVDAETGDNDAKDNTGGDVAIGTGDINVKVMVDNMAGFNHAYIDDCCYDGLYGKIAGNGTDSESYIGALIDQDMTLFQDNACGGGWDWPCMASLDQGKPHHWWGWDNDCFDNDLDIEAVTGDNEVEDNTAEGDSDPMIITGDSDVEVEVENMGGSNSYGDYAPDWDDLMPSMGFSFDFSFSLADLLAYFG